MKTSARLSDKLKHIGHPAEELLAGFIFGKVAATIVLAVDVITLARILPQKRSVSDML